MALASYNDAMNITWEMTAGELGQIIGLSTGIVFSLIFSCKALSQTKALKDKEYRQKLLNEIIDWASDIAAITNEFTFELNNREELTEYLTFNTKSEYVKEIARGFGDNIISSVDKVVLYIREGSKLIFNTLQLKDIDEQLRELNPWLEPDKYIDKVNSTLPKVRYSIRQSAIELMQVAALIKTKNI